MVGEVVEELLECGDGGGSWSGAEPFLEGGVEAFDFALGLGVVGGAVFLPDAEVGEEDFEAVGSAAVSGGEDESVVGQRGLRCAVDGSGGFECCDDDRSGDSGVGGRGDQVAGVVVDPKQDFDVGAVCESDVGEVCLPAFVG